MNESQIEQMQLGDAVELALQTQREAVPEYIDSLQNIRAAVQSLEELKKDCTELQAKINELEQKAASYDNSHLHPYLRWHRCKKEEK